MALPLVHAARHNDVKPLLGRELMILTHDDDDVCMYVTTSIRGWAGSQESTALLSKKACLCEEWGGFPYDDPKCWLGVDHIKRLHHCLVW